MSKLSTLSAAARQGSSDASLLQAIGDTASQIRTSGSHEVAGYAFASESLTPERTSRLVKAAETIESMVGAIAQRFSDEKRITASSREAAVQGALMALAAKEAFAMKPQVTPTVAGIPFAGMESMVDAFAKRSQFGNPANEAYNENNNSDVLKNTLYFNLLAGRQNEVGEMLFPTVVVPADNMGVSTTLRVYQVHDDIKRGLDGKKQNWNRKVIIRGIIDPDLLRNDTTRVIPVFRTGENTEFFTTDVPAYDYDLEGITIRTAPLAFGKSSDVIALSATDALINAGVLDRTDSLDAAVSIDYVYLKVGTDIIKIPAFNHAGSNFINVGQDNYRVQKLNFDSPHFVLTADTKNIAGADLGGDLAGIKTGKLAITFTAAFHGSVNIEEGSLKVSAVGAPEVVSAVNVETKEPVTGSALATIKTAIEAGTWAGYDVKAWRSNANHRERGQLVDTQYYTQVWAVPYRAPITGLKPVNAPAETEGAELDALVATTFIRTSVAALTTWFEGLEVMRTLKDVPHDPDSQPTLLGVSRYLLDPILIEDTINIPANLGNLTSFEFARDLQALLVNRIRDIAYRMYRDSGFQAVVESGAAGTVQQPTVLVFTDTMTGRYLMIDGETRTLGEQLNVVIKTTADKRMINKIGIAFGYPSENKENQLNSLHFGNMLWSPELVSRLPISRNNQISLELTVQPRFRHIINTPVMGFLQVNGLVDAVKSRTAINFNQI